jgi:hypothetical protein
VGGLARDDPRKGEITRGISSANGRIMWRYRLKSCSGRTQGEERQLMWDDRTIDGQRCSL